MQSDVRLTSNCEMSPKVIVFLALLAVAFAAPKRPYVGLRMPFMPQVVGGEEAEEGQFPWIVSLQWGINKDSSHFCAGSILNENWIMTAAHCINAVPPIGKFSVKAGKHDITVSESTEQVVEVKQQFKHNDYGGGVGPYDIGLLKLKTPLQLNDRVQAISLPEPNDNPTGAAILCGWGSTSQSSAPNMPDKLQYVNLEYVDIETCHKAVEDLTGSSPVHKTNVCTGPLTGGISACSGDSGGPLMTKIGNKIVQSGIVSWGIIPCGTPGAPSVYTGVSNYNSWIEQIINNY